jgi:hypothetical protein
VTILVDGEINPKLQCNHCDHLFCGGANRIREHVAGVGGNIRKCKGRGLVFAAAKERMVAVIAKKKSKKDGNVVMNEVDASASGKSSGFSGEFTAQQLHGF